MAKIKRLFPLIAIGTSLTPVLALNFDTNDPASVRDAAATLIQDLLARYPPAGGFFPELESYYWWLGGAFWGATIDYWSYTGDATHNGMTLDALASQTGPYDYVPPAQASSEANDDQAFWIFSVLDALEQGFPALECIGAAGGCANSYLKMADNAFNEFVNRYNADSSTCSGGLRWQFNPSNNGYDYKNTVSNGGFFNIASRLARFTGQKHYAEWASKIWDWETSVGLITEKYEVFDGVHVEDQCHTPDATQWTYNNAIHIHGAAMMYNMTGGSQIWRARIQGLMTNGKQTFFTPFKNASNIMYEPRCELSISCDIDNTSFKGYLARFWAKTTVIAPFTASTIRPLLEASAQGAASSCSGQGGDVCGMSWWYGGWDGTSGLGQQLSALETVQALLVGYAAAPKRQYYAIVAPPSSAAEVAPSSTSQSKSSRPASSTKAAVQPFSSSTSQIMSTTTSTSASSAIHTTSHLMSTKEAASTSITTHSTTKKATSTSITTHSTTSASSTAAARNAIGSVSSLSLSLTSSTIPTSAEAVASALPAASVMQPVQKSSSRRRMKLLWKHI